MLKIINKANGDVILFSSDNDPPQGFKIRRKFIATLIKTLSSQQLITFHAIEDPSRAKVLLNAKEWIQVKTEKGKPSSVVVTLTGKVLIKLKILFSKVNYQKTIKYEFQLRKS